MLALIDGDSVAYRCAAASENDEEWIAIARCNESVERILDSTKANECQIFLSDSPANNFRYALYPAYKANRPSERPRWLGQLKQFLTIEWNAQVAAGQEADDALGIAQCTYNEETIICANDKDMLMIPGHHYNFVKETYLLQDEISGFRHFYKQCMSGDRVDNIIKPERLRGFGAKKIDVMLDSINDPFEMFEAVREKYQDDVYLLLNGRLLWVRRKEKELWEFPTIQPAMADTSESSSSTQIKVVPQLGATLMDMSGDLKVGDSTDHGQTNLQD